MISNEQYQNIAPTGSRPGILYCLPKVHKPNIPVRPILSAINTHTYNLSKFLVPLLRPLSLSPYSITDSFSFIRELLSLNLDTDNLTMASYDITSLFTNVPLDETIEIILNKLYSTNQVFQGFTSPELKKLLNLSVKDCHFLFNGKFMIRSKALPWETH